VSAVVGNDPYELRIVLPADGAWKAAAVELSAEDAQAAVTSKMIADGVNLRVKLSSAASRAVRWKIRFVVK